MRKELKITLVDRGRNLDFKIKEMTSRRLESWLIRALFILAKSGADLPDNVGIKEAIEYIKKTGYRSLILHLDVEAAQPLLDELLDCCYIVQERMETKLEGDIIDMHIMDVTTLLTLRMKALELNFGFLLEGEESKLANSPENQPSGKRRQRGR